MLQQLFQTYKYLSLWLPVMFHPKMIQKRQTKATNVESTLQTLALPQTLICMKSSDAKSPSDTNICQQIKSFIFKNVTQSDQKQSTEQNKSKYNTDDWGSPQRTICHYLTIPASSSSLQPCMSFTTSVTPRRSSTSTPLLMSNHLSPSSLTLPPHCSVWASLSPCPHPHGVPQLLSQQPIICCLHKDRGKLLLTFCPPTLSKQTW